MLYSKCMDASPEPLRCHKVSGENHSCWIETGKSSSLFRCVVIWFGPCMGREVYRYFRDCLCSQQSARDVFKIQVGVVQVSYLQCQFEWSTAVVSFHLHPNLIFWDGIVPSQFSPSVMLILKLCHQFGDIFYFPHCCRILLLYLSSSPVKSRFISSVGKSPNMAPFCSFFTLFSLSNCTPTVWRNFFFILYLVSPTWVVRAEPCWLDVDACSQLAAFSICSLAFYTSPYK